MPRDTIRVHLQNAVGPSLRPPPTNYIQSPAAFRMREWCISAPTLSHYSCMLPDREGTDVAGGAGGPHGGTYTTVTARFSPWISYKTAPNNFRCDIFAGGARGCGAGAGANGRPAGSTKSSFSISLIFTGPRRNLVQLSCKSRLQNRGVVQGGRAAAGRVRELLGGPLAAARVEVGAQVPLLRVT